jgi:hypothetical protein
LSELFVETAGKPLQAEVPAMWVLPELLGLLLNKLLIVDF